MLEKLLRSKAEVAVLSVVLFTEDLHLREIARRAGISSYEAKRELDNLFSLGVLVKKRKGNLILFKTNPSCPFLGELRSLYMKTEGIFSCLKKELSQIKEIKFALIYGSMAKEEYSEKSDLDLLIVGDIQEEQVERAILKLQKKFEREINYILWTEKEFEDKKRERGAFVNSLLKSKKIMLVGDESELIRVGKEWHD
ncbi:MAG: nucleotidyltransferase domain-containing protein [Candidatus Anstonellales archaeon]